MHTRPKLIISRRILVGFGLLIGLYAVHGLYLFQAMDTLSNMATGINDQPLEVSNAALKANSLIIKMHLNLEQMVLAHPPAKIDAAAALIDRLEGNVLDEFTKIRRRIPDDRGKRLAADGLSQFQEWTAVCRRTVDLIRQGEREEAIAIVRTQSPGYVARLETQMDALNQYARSEAHGVVVQIARVNQQVSSWSFVLLLAWIVLSAMIAFFTARGSRQIEEALATEKERLGVTLKSIGDGVIATDEEGDVMLMNRVAETMTGWTEAEALGKPIESVFIIVNEHSRVPCENPVAKVLSSRCSVGLANHTLLIARDGSERAIADSGAPIQRPDGQTIGVALVFRDQTEERNYQKQIRESERKYRLISENTIDVIWTMNFELEFTYVNSAIEALAGFAPHEWIGSRLPDHCDEENFERMAAIVANEMARGPGSSGIYFEAVMLKKNRQPIEVEIRGRVIYDEDGQPDRIQGVTRDISQRKADEAVRRYQDKLLREMGRLAKIGAWEFDPASGDGTWTDEVARIHDLSPTEKATLSRGIGFYRGESRQRIEAAINEAVNSGKSYDLELELISAKNVHKWVRTIGRPKFQDGSVVNIRGSFQDITERKRSEQRIEHLNRVLRAIRDLNQLIVHEKRPAVLIHDGCNLLVDHRGYTSAVIILVDDQDRPVSWASAGLVSSGQSLDAMLHGGRLPKCCELARNESAVTVVSDHTPQCDGCHAAVDMTQMHSLAVPLAYETERFGYLVVSLNPELSGDLEERHLLSEIAGDLAYALHTRQLDEDHKRSELERKELEQQLIQAQKMESIGRLAGGVAHDYNNMLGVIMGYAEMAMGKVAPDTELMGDLEEIFSAANRSAEITRQLLAFARQQTVNPRMIELNRVIERMLNMLRRLIGEDIDLICLPGTELWGVKIDPMQIDQILANLCVNARDAIGGVGKITIETENVSIDEAYCAAHVEFRAGDYVRLAVSDDGCGMDPQTKEKIFEPFFTTKAVGKGTGLGMATVYGIIKQNQGLVNVYSEPGKGTTIRVYLPRYEGVVADGQTDLETVPLGRGETLLLVEDDDAILKLGVKMLVSSGYDVLAAGTPGEAQALAQTHADRIRLMITDVVMPEMNGRDLVARIRESRPDLKVLFMSGYPANVIARQGILEAGVHFIQKPFSRKELAKKVRQALDQETADE